jgi:tripartite-type tricarboxylate transporter receptor subunit TctC
MTLWSGLWVPKGTPKDIVAKLNAAAVDALNDPAVRKQLENLGLQMPPKDQLSPQRSATGRRPKSQNGGR